MTEERDQPSDEARELIGEAPPKDGQPTGTEPELPPARVPPVVVPRWVQAVVLLAGLFALWALAKAAGVVLLIFIVAALIALILNPLVKLLQQGRLPRGAAIAVVYVGFFGALAGSVALLVNPVSNQVEAFQEDVPDLVHSANRSLADVQDWLDARGIDIEVKHQGQTALETLRDKVLEGSGSIVSFTRDLVRTLVELGFALILILVLSIYMLVYGEQIGALVRRVMPPGDGTPEDDFPTRVQKAVFGYGRGQLTFSLVMGVSAGVALWLLGVAGIFPDGKTYALFFGAFYGLMELIPYVGPVLGALPPVLVALFQDPLTVIWLVILFVALQQLEGHLVAPQVFGHHLRINPLLVIFALLFGAQLYGILGALLALPLAAIGRETVVYLNQHLVLEPWGTLSPETIETRRIAERRAEAERCPECGAPAGPDDAFCAACGTRLHAPVEISG